MGIGRQVPKGADRGPRTNQVAIYLSKEEVDALDKYAKSLGLRSKATLIVKMIEGPIRDGLSPLSFVKVGHIFLKLIEQIPNSKIGWEQLNPFRRQVKFNNTKELDKNEETS